MTLPNVLITGMPKCGTTSLVENLAGHSDIFMSRKTDKARSGVCALHDEIMFFDVKYNQGLSWYADLFQDATNEKIVCEKSPHYMNCLENQALKRIIKDLPDVKIIMCVRDPVYRAYSQWNHIQRPNMKWMKHLRGVPFIDALKWRNEHNMNMLLSNGCYADILNKAEKLGVNLKNVVVISQEYMKKHPDEVMPAILSQLGVDTEYVPEGGWDTTVIQEGYPEGAMSEEAFEYLYEYYKFKNEDFFKIVGREYDWMEI